MSNVRVLVIRAAGINCDEETVHCWRLAGAEPTLLHINAVAERPAIIADYPIVTIPGGFSYGDDLGAGVILAQRILQRLDEPLRRLVDRGGGVLGICNGFQVLAKMGLLPGGEFGRDQVTVTYNDSARFEARWVRLQVGTRRCAFLGRADAAAGIATGTTLEMPVEHAEGKVVTSGESVTRRLDEKGLIALRYVDEQGRFDTYPANPNGSVAGIAGLCDETGRVFGLMPHPDRHFDHIQHPLHTRRRVDGPADGLTIFLNAVRFWGG